MKSNLLILLSLIYVVQIAAQHKYDYNWLFGFNTNTASILNFNEDLLIIDTAYNELRMAFTGGTISDKSGKLLFYTNACDIYDASFNLMENGGGLNPGTIADDNCAIGYSNLHQSLIILPSLTNDSIFHLFHQRLIIDPDTEVLFVSDSLFHTIVNTNGNNGLGEVIQKNKPINSLRMNSGYIATVKKTGGNAWWMVVPLSDSNGYEIFEIEGDTVVSTKIQNISETFLDIDPALQSLFSLDGTKYIRAFSEKGILIFDFDRSSGVLSNPLKIEVEPLPSFVGGMALSSNGRFLYLNSAITLWQYDLEAADIEASRVLIAEYDGFESPGFTNFWKAQIGPDCKIYYNSSFGVDRLHVMHNPNAKGVACNFEQHGIKTNSPHGRNMSYFPSFRLDTNEPLCDTTKLVATSIQFPIRTEVTTWKAYPNPTSGLFNIEFQGPVTQEYDISIYDVSGSLIQSKQLQKGERKRVFDLQGYAKGIYFYRISVDGVGIFNGKLVRM